MRKSVLIFFLLFVSAAASQAEEDISLVRNNCYSSINRVYCTGLIKNNTGADISNVIIHFSSPYLRLHAPKINTDIFDEIEILPAGETSGFKVVWDARQLAGDIMDQDILREYILTTIENGSIQIRIYTQPDEPEKPEK